MNNKDALIIQKDKKNFTTKSFIDNDIQNIKIKNLKTNFLGRTCFLYPKIDSTQKEIWKKQEKNEIANGTLIVGKVQTDGIGTHGRKWYTLENNIAFSFIINSDFIFPSNISIDRLEGFTLEIAEVLKEVFKKLYDINTNQEIFPDEIQNIATSIKKEFNVKIDNESIISEFCNIMEKKIIERLGEK